MITKLAGETILSSEPQEASKAVPQFFALSSLAPVQAWTFIKLSSDTQKSGYA